MRKPSRATEATRPADDGISGGLDVELHRRGLRATPARRYVLSHLRLSADHPTVEELMTLLAAHGHPLSAATVYQNLERLVEAGLVSRFLDDRGRYRFDADQSHHHHLACTRCARITNLETDATVTECVGQVAYEVTALAIREWRVEDVRLVVLGVCPVCQQAERPSTDH
jgi:Fe2+ or Zn2+ uptake regulation protein